MWWIHEATVVAAVEHYGIGELEVILISKQRISGRILQSPSWFHYNVCTVCSLNHYLLTCLYLAGACIVLQLSSTNADLAIRHYAVIFHCASKTRRRPSTISVRRCRPQSPSLPALPRHRHRHPSFIIAQPCFPSDQCHWPPPVGLPVAAAAVLLTASSTSLTHTVHPLQTLQFHCLTSWLT